MFTVDEFKACIKPLHSRIDTPGAQIARVSTDSRQITHGIQCAFFALHGKRTDGHLFLSKAWEQGVRNFVVEEGHANGVPENGNVFFVDDVMRALQDLAIAHRARHDVLCIGITGSNGKTWVKEWLYQLLHRDYNIVKSPRSYNSQIGVPLSVLQMTENHDLAIFEAGISRTGEMERLVEIIKPDIGILTHFGDAHDAGFPDRQTKLKEKCLLFRDAQTVIYPADDEWLDNIMHTLLSSQHLMTWGHSPKDTLHVRKLVAQQGTRIHYAVSGKEGDLEIPFSDQASIRNALTAHLVMTRLGYTPDVIAQRAMRLQPIEMRLEIHKLPNTCLLINDTYSLDLASLRVGLETLEQHSSGMHKALIISDIDRQHGHTYVKIADLINQRHIDHVYAIGRDVAELSQSLDSSVSLSLFPDVGKFVAQRPWEDQRNTVYLLKGGRRFKMEQIVGYMQARSHSAILEIDLNAMLHNIQYFSTLLAASTKIIAMVKAAAYGSGSTEVGKFLEFHNVDMLGVAYLDEGVELRRAGVQVPVIVMNSDRRGIHQLIDHRLEPEIYDAEMLRAVSRAVSQRQRVLNVHLKVNTGMHRLGFEYTGAQALKALVETLPGIRVASIFTHLAASGDPGERDYTIGQVERFSQFYEAFCAGMKDMPMRHVLNSRGILNYPEYQFEAVRLGIGLYGVGVGEHADFLQPVHAMKARISQIHNVAPGDSVGYGRAFVAGKQMRIATINAGYADGLMRAAGNGAYAVVIRGVEAPIVGVVCMDMCMVDITQIGNVAIGDEVIVFGPGHSVDNLAEACGTIPYEILTSISPRVPRVFRFA